MGQVYERIDERIQRWVAAQPMFFVGSAPLSATGHINVSPKGLDTLRILDDRTLAFLDSGGSGIETVAHVRENARIVIMLCAFEGQAKIFRFHGRGEIVTPIDTEFASLVEKFDTNELGVRSIVRVHIDRISDSCGYGVPLMSFEAQRNISQKYLRSRGMQHVRDSAETKNQASIDGLPGISVEEAQNFYAPDYLRKPD